MDTSTAGEPSRDEVGPEGSDVDTWQRRANLHAMWPHEGAGGAGEVDQPDRPVPRTVAASARGVTVTRAEIRDISLIKDGSMWEQQRWQLSPGPFEATWTQVTLAPGVVVMQEVSTSSQRVRLRSKVDFLCLGFYACPGGPMLMDGREIAPDESVLITPGAVFDSTIPGGLRADHLCVFRDAYDLLWPNEPERARMLDKWLSVRVTPLRADPGHAHELKGLLDELLAVHQWPQAWADMPAGYLADLVVEAAGRLLDSAVPRQREPEIGRPSLRRMAALAAEKYLLEAGDRPVSTLELCRHTGVSERTLQAAMLDQFGQTPMAYLRTLRLGQVREALRRAAPSDTVQAIALRFGFLHHGRFAGQYREHFGEPPGQTLRRHTGE